MKKPTLISVTEAARNFADCVNRARYQNQSFILVKNGKAVARLVPETEKESTGADLAKARHAGIAGHGERAETGDGGGATEEQRATDGDVGEVEITVMASQGQLHKNTIIHAGAEDERERHEIEQVPRPAHKFHGHEQDQTAEEQDAEAENNFGEAMEGEPERKQDERDHWQ